MKARELVAPETVGGHFHLHPESRSDARARWHAAYDTRDGTPAMVRLLRSSPGDDVDKWLRAVRAASGLKRPFVKVLDAGRLEDGTPWIATPPLPSRTLEDELAQRRPHTPEQLAPICATATAIADLHQARFSYGEVEPARILLGERGVDLLEPTIPWALDKARSIVIDISLYMAPEGRGQPADVFAVATIAYEMLTGSFPYVDREALLAGRTTPGALPRQFIGALRSALAPDPSIRPKMAELASVLSSIG